VCINILIFFHITQESFLLFFGFCMWMILLIRIHLRSLVINKTAHSVHTYMHPVVWKYFLNSNYFNKFQCYIDEESRESKLSEDHKQCSVQEKQQKNGRAKTLIWITKKKQHLWANFWVKNIKNIWQIYWFGWFVYQMK